MMNKPAALTGLHHLPRGWIMALTVALLASALAAAIAWTVASERSQVLILATAHVGFDASVFAERADHELEAAATALATLAESLQTAPAAAIPSTLVPAVSLRRRLLTLPGALDLVIYDAEGRLAGHASPRPLADATPPWFAQQKALGVDFFIPPAWHWGVQQRRVLALSRTLWDGNGGFRGIAVAVIDLDLLIPPEGRRGGASPISVVLFDLDGSVIAARLAPGRDSGNAALDHPVQDLPGFSVVPQGSFAAQGSGILEDSDHLVAVNQLPSFPLRVGVTAEKAEILAAWRDKSVKAGLFSLTLLAIAAIFLMLWRRASATEMRLLDELRQLYLAVDQSPASIVIADIDANLEYVNPAFLQLTGYTQAEVIGQNPRLLQSGQMPPEHYATMWQTLTAGEVWRGEFFNKTKSGSLYWESAVISPLIDSNGRVTHYVAVKDNITRRKDAEQQLALSSAELSRSNVELEQFAYVASHDLRQPLRMVTSYLTLLERHLGASLDDDGRMFMHFAVDGAKHMDALITGLLEYSRVGRRDGQRQRLSLSQIIADVLVTLAPAMAETGGTVTVAPDLPGVDGDSLQLFRLFENVIGNALKYHRPDVAPQITITSEDDGERWVITINDNGIGIAPKDAERVFGIFQRLVTQSEFEGTGIGLAVCRKIAEHHGGAIWVQPCPGQGSCFRIAFPKANA